MIALIAADIGRLPPIVERLRRGAACGRREGEGPASGPLARTAQPRGAGGFPPVGRGVAPNRLYLSHIAAIIARVYPLSEKGKARKMDISKLTHGAKLVLGATILFLIVSFFNWFELCRHRRLEHVARRRRSWPACSPSCSSSGRLSASNGIEVGLPLHPAMTGGRARDPGRSSSRSSASSPVPGGDLGATRCRAHVLGLARVGARDCDRGRRGREHEGRRAQSWPR